LHAIEGSPPQRPPQRLAQQAIATEQSRRRVVARVASCGLVAAPLLRARRPRMRILGPTPLPTMPAGRPLGGAEPPCVVDHVAKRGVHAGLPIASRRLGVVSEGARGILPALLRALESAVALFGSGVELGQPAKRAQAGDEAVFAAAVDHEPGQVRQAAADGPLGDGGQLVGTRCSSASGDR
jgi:hypothetical protein